MSTRSSARSSSDVAVAFDTDWSVQVDTYSARLILQIIVTNACFDVAPTTAASACMANVSASYWMGPLAQNRFKQVVSL